MRVLAIDTALQSCGAAILDGHGVTVDEAVIDKGHAEYLIPQIDRLMARVGIGFADIGKVVVCVGPGSFTGIRAGLAAARGFGLALGIPVVGVTTLEALAREGRALTDGPVLALIDARRGEVYVQTFAADGTELDPPAVLSLAEAGDRARASGAALIGSGAPLVAPLVPSARLLDDRAQASIVTIAHIGAARAPGVLPPGPLYIRAADAKPQANYALARAAHEVQP